MTKRTVKKCIAVSLTAFSVIASTAVCCANPAKSDKEIAGNKLHDYNAELFKALDSDESFIISPYSIIDCLTLSYDGLSDKAKKAMERKGITKESVEAFKAFDSESGTTDDLSVANKVYLNSQFDGKYNLDLIRKDSVENIKMDSSAAGIMNSWIEDKTHDKIKDLISESNINIDTAMVLINAIYMKRQWLDEDYSGCPIPWEDGKEYKGFTGNASISDVRDVDDYTILRIPYMPEYDSNGNTTNSICMYAITENETKASKAIKPFDPLAINRYLSAFNKEKNDPEYDEAIFYMPKFKTQFKNSVKDVLKKIGLKDVLSAKAYEKIGPIKVDDVLHGAYIKTNKHGTEAAAATAMMMKEDAMVMDEPSKIREIHFNKPFYYIIKDDVSGIVLFEGKVCTDSLKLSKNR